MPDANGLRVKLLGPPSVTWQGQPVPPPPPKVFALLAYLVVEGRGVARDELAGLLWHGKMHSVRQALYALRALPGAREWLREDQVVQVLAESDVQVLRRALKAERFGAAPDPLGEVDPVLLPGLEVQDAPAFSGWLDEQREQVREQFLQVARGVARRAEQEGRFPEAAAALERLVALDPLDEDGHRALMRVLARAGRVEDALAAFEHLRQVLRREVDAEPAAETLALLGTLEEGGGARGTRAVLVRGEPDVPGFQEVLFGREDDVERAGAQLAEHGRVLLHGLGGVGKTALAARLVAGALGRVPGPALWLEVGDDGPETVFDALARPFGAHGRVARGSPPERAQALARTLESEGVALIVLDDVWNAYTLARVREALPPGIRLLVTSRQRYPGWPRVTLHRLPRPAALALLRHTAPHLPPTDSRADALCALLGDHPYALRLAGLQLRQEGLSSGQLLARVQGAPHDLNVPGEGSVAALLAVSVERLGDAAYEAFWTLGGLFAPSVTPELLARALRRAADEAEDALFELAERGLARRDVPPGQETPVYRTHDLAFSFARARRSLRPASALRAVLAFVDAFAQRPDVLNAELSNILGALRLAREAGEPDALVALTYDLTVRGAYLSARGYAPELLEALAAAARAAAGQGDAATAYALFVQLGNAHMNHREDYEQAAGAFDEAVRLARDLADGALEARALSSYGVMRFNGGYADGEALVLAAVELARSAGDEEGLCLALERQGYVAGSRGDHAGARAALSEELGVARRLARTVGDEGAQRRLFYTLLNLCEANLQGGLLDDAWGTGEEALRLAEQTDRQVWTAFAADNLARVAHERGQHDAAAPLITRALTLYARSEARPPMRRLLTFARQAGYPVDAPAGT